MAYQPTGIRLLSREVFYMIADLLTPKQVMALLLTSKGIAASIGRCYLIRRDLVEGKFHAFAWAIIKRDTKLLSTLLSLSPRYSLKRLPPNIFGPAIANSPRDFIFAWGGKEGDGTDIWDIADAMCPTAPPHLRVPDHPLCMAAVDRDTVFAEFLLLHGATPNQYSADDRVGKKTPLELVMDKAIAKCGTACPLLMTRLLLRYGADPNSDLQSAFDFLYDDSSNDANPGNSDNGNSSLLEAVSPLFLALRAGKFTCQVHWKTDRCCVAEVVEALVAGGSGGCANPALYDSKKLARAVGELRLADRRPVVEILVAGGVEAAAFTRVLKNGFRGPGPRYKHQG